MKIEAVKVQRLYLQVAEQLSAQINDGGIKLGARLPSERDLASSFGVSRPTIREAMIALEVAGLVEVRSGSGVYVLRAKSGLQALRQQDDPGPIEILEARLLFESEAAALAAERSDEADIQQLQNTLATLSSTEDIGSQKEVADRDFHLTIAHASKNSAIESTINWLWDLRDDSTISHFFHDKLRSAGIKPVIADHQAIFDAITSRSPEQARRAMRDHLGRVMDVVLDNPTPATN